MEFRFPVSPEPQARRPPAWRLAHQTRLAIGLCLLICAAPVPRQGALAAQEPESGISAETASEEASEPSEQALFLCPTCQGEGSVSCPTCGGRGQIFEKCPICGGSGERPCPSCAKAKPGRPEEELTPGLVPCSYCGGRGTVGTTGKVCPKCQGAQFFTCPTCHGRATVSCRTEVFVRICPTCRFTRKIVCPTCQGKKHLTQEELASATSRLSASDPSARDLPSGGGTGRAAGEETGDESLSSPSADERFLELFRLHERYTSVAGLEVVQPIQAIHSHSTAVLRHLKAVSDNKTAELVQRLEAVRRRVQDLRIRWRAFSDGFERYQKAFHQSESVRKSGQAPPSTADDAWRESWRKTMDITLNVAESSAKSLAALDPASIPVELESLKNEWTEISAEAEEILRALEEERSRRDKNGEEAEETDAAPAAAGAAPEDGSDAASRESPAGGAATSSVRPAGASSGEQSAAEKRAARAPASEADERRSSASAKESAARDGSPQEAAPERDAGSGWSLLWTAGALATVSLGALILFSLWRRRKGWERFDEIVRERGARSTTADRDSQQKQESAASPPPRRQNISAAEKERMRRELAAWFRNRE